ncbi:hypothetical protein HBI56_230030 [Parastagonospora nodorum]|nr:hypothetical protein HBH53_036570 [Parastagonospora nodorum]KAH3984655.1 hypothetical protein HBH51_026710 [Parastagonospora nodorum]KAH4000317.1 hypothetical protein HBI10_099490 [Parastagonospora nodorum]KAH4026740.1 hypothetical protein HBI13_066110 [Parastagonospora nodorum]KAH4036806.1 hypothetical protein HBI09_077650 [Parastagonospora nodorum]
MRFTKPLLLVAAVANASPFASPPGPGDIALTGEEFQALKDGTNGWVEVSMDKEIPPEQLPVPHDPAADGISKRQGHISTGAESGAFGIFDCHHGTNIRRSIIARISIRGSDTGANNGATQAVFSSVSNADGFRPYATVDVNDSSGGVSTTAYHKFCTENPLTDPVTKCGYYMEVPFAARFQRGTTLVSDMDPRAPTLREACAAANTCPAGLLLKACSLRAWGLATAG